MFTLFCYFFQLFGKVTDDAVGFLSCLLLSSLTGFFHEDGLADAFDSLGVSKYGDSQAVLDRIHSAMKDSRLGAFGVHGLIFVWALRYIAFFEFKVPWQLWVLVVFASRMAGLSAAWFVSRSSKLTESTRSGHLMKDVTARSFFVYFISSVISVFVFDMYFHFSGFVKYSGLISSIVLGIGCYFWLKKISVRSDGLSGDLIGSAILISEMIGVLLFKILKVA
jgi:cobalamin synthase